MILFLLLFILLIFLLVNRNETFIDSYTPDFISIYNSRLGKYKNTNIKILLIGSISQNKLNFINNYFNNCIIYVSNEDKTYYNNLSDNIIQSENNPFDIGEVNNFITNHINFDIILTCGQISIDNYIFIAKAYVHLLTTNGIILFENVQSIENASSIINAIPLDIKNEINIIDLRKIYPTKYDRLCILLDKSQ
jgi:DNA-directed RNA polymerase subunit L